MAIEIFKSKTPLTYILLSGFIRETEGPILIELNNMNPLVLGGGKCIYTRFSLCVSIITLL